MIRALYNSASGINTQQARIDTTANNIAGLNVDAYKSQRPSFADLVYAKMSDSGRPVGSKSEKPGQGAGSRLVGADRNFAQGIIRETGKDTDLAISGSGFFKIITADEKTYYTRNGNFSLNAAGKLVTAGGDRLYPDIVVPEGSRELMVDKNGKVQVRDMEGDIAELSELTLYKFINPAGLKAVGEGLFEATEEAGQEEEGVPGQEGFGEIVQKSLESSNVDLVFEITELVESNRVYQMNAQVLKTADDMWGIANNLRKG